MILKNKFGDKIEITLDPWWSIISWVEFFIFYLKFRNCRVRINRDGWNITQITTED